jgi:hypothetical protein
MASSDAAFSQNSAMPAAADRWAIRVIPFSVGERNPVALKRGHPTP